MPENRSNSPNQTRPKTTSLHPQVSTLSPNTQNMRYKARVTANKIPEKMGVRAPLEIGTRGTIGSLMRQEIEYLESQKPRCQYVDTASTYIYSAPTLGSLIKAQRKKKRGGNKLIPSMCSVVDVAEVHRPNGASVFSYRNLKADVKKLQA